MNPAIFHPDFRPPHAAELPHAPELTPSDLAASFVEPGGEGIVFSAICLFGSAIIYVAVLLL